MKKNVVKIGGTYAAKVSGKVVPVRIESTNPHGGWDGVNRITGKKVHIKSPQRLRGLWPTRTMPIVHEAADAPQAAPTPPEPRQAATDATPASGRHTGERGATGAAAKRPSLLNLAAQVLAEAGRPMTCKEIVEAVLAGGQWTTEGKTPAATLTSAVLREIAAKGDAARFRKTGRGLFEAAV
ncbi:MAG TPA: winged helix-turn-helix domain-containing protein [Phycisphaerae bacterium]|nr:hypothetical protein [Phycisphaerae bacterium]HOI56351.1 winged helix-turn-helix domain-containing protein [Phycisphaerae bacterium]